MAELKNTTVSGTDAMQLPVGTTAQRPGSPAAAMVRYNSSDGRIEYYNNNWWYAPPLIFSNNTQPNPTNIFSWCSTAAVNNATISRDSMTSPFKNTPLKMSVTGNDPHIQTYNSATWNAGAAANGQTWQVRVYCRASVATSIQIFIFGANSAGNWTGAPGTITSQGFNVTTDWREYVAEYTFGDPNVAFIQSRLDGPDAGGAGQTIWFDGYQVRRVA